MGADWCNRSAPILLGLCAAVAAWLNEATVPQQLAQQLEHHILHDPTMTEDSLAELSQAYEVLQANLI